MLAKHNGLATMGANLNCKTQYVVDGGCRRRGGGRHCRRWRRWFGWANRIGFVVFSRLLGMQI